MKIDIKTIMKYSKSLTALYVEDDDILRESTRKIFATFFHSVEVCNDGKEAFDKYLDFREQRGEYYDLVITDINMPNMNGIEMSKLIMEENPLQSLIFITAYNDSEYLQDAIDIGSNGFLSKPIDPKKLQLLLYKTTKAISDSKTISEFFTQIEELNTELEKQNEELKKRYDELEKSQRMLNTIVEKENVILSKKEENQLDTVEQNYIREQMQQFISEDLQEIQELHVEIDSNVISVISCPGNIHNGNIENISNGFVKYSSLLSYYTFFNELGTAMKDFASTISTNPLPDDIEKINDIFVLLESFLFVLDKWNKDLKNSDAAVSFFDASLISDMRTITMMWTLQNSENEEYDDIFF